MGERAERSASQSRTGDVVTPMIAQYLEIKAANPASLLFYRMGDFYELFFEDAETASRALGIALTKRGKHLGQDIPMCGVPIHAAGDYLNKLIRLGHRIAVCEQTEDPAEARKRGGKAVVRREVVRVVTAGTLTEDTLLSATRNNYLAAIAEIRSEALLGLAWVDISTGAFAVMALDPQMLPSEIARLEPSEIIIADTPGPLGSIAAELASAGAALMPLPPSHFDSAAGEARLKRHFAVHALEAFGAFSRPELAAAGALLDYVGLTQAGRLPRLEPPRRRTAASHMMIDQASRANLEIGRSLSGERQGSLIDALDLTVTPAGARLLAERLAAPLTDPDEIGDRLDAVTLFCEDQALRRDCRAALARAPDIRRPLARLSLGRGGPRDLSAIGSAIGRAGEIAARFHANVGRAQGLAALPREIEGARLALAHDLSGLALLLDRALGDELPALARDGGFVRAGFKPEIDESRRLRDDSRRVIAGLESRYAEMAAIKSLKIKHNNVLGYFIEVNQVNGQKLLAPPLSETFVHRQTMANVMRFTTVELSDIDQRIVRAGEQVLALEMQVFAELVEALTREGEALEAMASALATIDVAQGLAERAVASRWSRPKVDSSLSFRIVGGRHPVVEAALKRDGGQSFVPNDCNLTATPDGGRHVWLVTGPNMAGKSTFLRQNALIAILAQAGSYVPAETAHIGISDRLFSRVGAADDLARGRSTFMVEMVETAAILNQAGERSLVILDEIGRGTATFDGLSIAWAAVEHLHDVNRCRSLFATHFHELTALSSRLPRLANVTVKVKEWQGEVVFLHEVGPGAADRSYGIQVAKLAGLPRSVIARASEILAVLEKSERGRAATVLVDDLPLFAAAAADPQHPAEAPGPSPLESRIDAIRADELTPRQALELIYELKAMLAPGRG
jgi:DNA mismatch repair protein MutS